MGGCVGAWVHLCVCINVHLCVFVFVDFMDKMLILRIRCPSYHPLMEIHNA